MTRHLWLLATLLLVGLVPILGQPVSFTIAIVRPDGHIIPFAAYANGRWEHAWPAADEGDITGPTFENTQSVWRRRGQPVPRIWHLPTTTGNRPLHARVSGVDAFDSHCQTQIALKTDLPPLKDLSAPNHVAIDSRQTVNRIEEVQLSDAVWTVAERVVAREFEMREASRARAGQIQLPVETPSPAVRIKYLYREARIERSPMYFVAEKQYQKELNPFDAGCKARTIMTGWLIAAGGAELAISSPQIFLSDCDGVEVRTAVAMAVLHLEQRVFWVLEETGYEDTEYLLVEVTPSGVRRHLAVNGGAC